MEAEGNASPETDRRKRAGDGGTLLFFSRRQKHLYRIIGAYSSSLSTMPKAISSDEGDSPRRFIPRPCLLCTLDIQGHYLDELEAKFQLLESAMMPKAESKTRK